MSFEITFLGASGGPIEASNCALLIKPADFAYSDVQSATTSPLVMIDAGSGSLLLAEIIHNEQAASERLLRLYPDSLQTHEYLELAQSYPFKNLTGSPFHSLKTIMLCATTLLVTHPHLDHILALVLNLAGLATTENTNLNVYALDFTVDALQKYVFNGVIWPDMVKLNIFGLHRVQPAKLFLVNDGMYTVTMMELRHGVVADGTTEAQNYVLLAFLLCHNASRSKILVFGDFEADKVLGAGLNRLVWQYVAPSVADGTLKAIVLECSLCTVTSSTDLYGHLMPAHLIGEFETLKSFGVDIKGLHVIVTHVKETTDGPDPRKKVLQELRALNTSKNLGLRFSMALSGLLVVV